MVSSLHDIERDLQKAASMLSSAESTWEMRKDPEPIYYVLARRAVATMNDWIAGARLVEDLQALKRVDSKNFNPHGWFGREYTEFHAGKPAMSPTRDRWIPNIERSTTQPYQYRL